MSTTISLEDSGGFLLQSDSLIGNKIVLFLIMDNLRDKLF